MSENLKEIIESLIFISPDPLPKEKIKDVLQDFPEEEIEKAIEELLQDYSSSGHGVHIVQTGGGYIFTTRREFDPWVRRLLQVERKNRLSLAALETLSSVAYHQPITLAEISALRGVDSTSTLRTLLEKKLVKIVGRKRGPGKPLLYSTTDKFLIYFGLNNLDDLPSEAEISRLLEENFEKQTT